MHATQYTINDIILHVCVVRRKDQHLYILSFAEDEIQTGGANSCCCRRIHGNRGMCARRRRAAACDCTQSMAYNILIIICSMTDVRIPCRGSLNNTVTDLYVQRRMHVRRIRVPRNILSTRKSAAIPKTE